MSASDEGLVCALRILFDGKDPPAIATAMHEALGEKTWPLYWRLGERLPIAHMYGEDAEGVEWKLDGMGLNWVGTDFDMLTLLKELEGCVISDYAGDAMHDYVRNWVEEYVKKHKYLVQPQNETANP